MVERCCLGYSGPLLKYSGCLAEGDCLGGSGRLKHSRCLRDDGCLVDRGRLGEHLGRLAKGGCLGDRDRLAEGGCLEDWGCLAKGSCLGTWGSLGKGLSSALSSLLDFLGEGALPSLAG